MIELKIKMEEGSEDLFPSYSTEGSAAFDLKAASSEIIPAGKSKFIKLSLSADIPQGYAIFIYARSGLGGKQGIRPANCTGIIDEDYHLPWGAFMKNDSDVDYEIKRGDRICQAVLQKVERAYLVQTMQEIEPKTSRSGGWGSTGLR